MKTDTIEEIGIDASGRLYVKPATQNFHMIWRSGAEVHWDVENQSLYSPKPREWSFLDWYKHILAVAKEGDGGGCILRITASIVWTNIPVELKSQILSLPIV